MDFMFVPAPAPHIADYVVIAVFLCICMGIGVYYGYQTNKNPTLENYFLGNRRLLLLPVAMSLVVTFASAISLIGIPSEIYVFGIRGIYTAFAYASSVMIASFTLVPLLYPLRLTSTYEYLQLRFRSKGVRTLGTLIGMLHTVGYMGVSLYAPGLALQIVACIPLWLSIVVIGIVGTVYTAIGGIKSVVWTDAFQFIMIFVGLTAVTIKGTMIFGTRFSIGEVATEGGRLDFFNFDPDPRTRHTIWGLWIGITFAFLPNWCNQSSVQRISSLRSLQAAKRAFWLIVPTMAVYYGILAYLGILIYSYYNILKCDPVQAGFLTNVNQVMPYFTLDVMRSLPGLSGIYISCLFSGALSTLSSGINALAANTLEDILGDCVKNSKIISQTLVAKICVCSYGLIVVGLAYAINTLSGSINQISLSVLGACGGPLVGLFFLGGMIPKANWIGAIVGSLMTLSFNIWLSVSGQIYGKRPVKLVETPTSGCFHNNLTSPMNESSILSYNLTMNTTPHSVNGSSGMSPTSPVSSEEGFFLYNLSYTWYGFIGFFLTLSIGTLVSLCTGGDRGEPVEARFIFPICRKVCGLKPKGVYEEAEVNENSENQFMPDDKTPNIFCQSNDDDVASPLQNK